MTKQLREKIAELEYVLHSKYYGRKYGYHKWDDLPPVMRDEIYSTATQILEACQKAGLAFVVKDAEIPRAELPKYPISTKRKAYQYGVEDQCRLQARAGWQKTEEIELT